MNLLLKCFDRLLLNYSTFSQFCIKYLDNFIPQNTIEIKQILLHPPHSSSGRTQDITTEIPNKLDFLNLSSLIYTFNKNYHPKSNIEIIYYWQEQIYRIVYDYNDPIIFPPYTIEDLEKKEEKYKNGVLFAIYLEQDVTDLIKGYAGPKGNFYEDKKLTITLNKLKCGLEYRGFLVGEGDNLIITDNYAEDHAFGENDIIKI